MTDKTPTLSIILIADERHMGTLTATVQSIEGQSRQPLEKVLVFDSKESYHVRGWKCLNGHWEELASSVNFAVANTDGDFLAIIEAGRVIPRGFTSSALKYVRENRETPMVEIGDIQVWNANIIINLGCWQGTRADMLKKLSAARLKSAKIASPKTVEAPKKETVSVGPVRTHSVVITNFKRPNMLREAFNSCMAANVQNLVITSSGVDKEVETVHQEILRRKPDTKIVSETGDSGCNKNWIAGINATRTDFVTLLHDDDRLNPSFKQVVNAIQQDVGFVVWDGSKHGHGSENDGFYSYLPFLRDGIHDAKMAFEALIKPDGLTLSPVGAAFKRDQMLRVLHECEENFSGPEFHLRPSMMVGNDHLLWLRAAQQNSNLRYIKKQLVSYGHHAGSASFDDAINQRGRLLPIYQKTREYFLEEFPKIHHVVPRYEPKDAGTVRRIAKAEFSWKRLYDTGIVHPAHVWEQDYKRNSKEIGDRRCTPFLKDMLQHGLDRAGSGDYVMLTNDDTMIHPLCLWAVHGMMSREEVCCAFRVSFDRGKMPPLDADPQVIGRTGFFDKGRDLFVFSKSWLSNNLNRIPDYVLGSTDWDSTLGIAFRKWRDIPVTVQDYCSINPRSELPLGYVYHENHVAFWSATNNRRKIVAGNTYNRELSHKFIKENGVGWVI